MSVTIKGIDAAKHVFQVHGADRHGNVLVKKRLSGLALVKFMANLWACVVGMEVCGSANYWSHELQNFRHEVRPMNLQFVKPYVNWGTPSRETVEGGLSVPEAEKSTHTIGREGKIVDRPDPGAGVVKPSSSVGRK